MDANQNKTYISNLFHSKWEWLTVELALTLTHPCGEFVIASSTGSDSPEAIREGFLAVLRQKFFAEIEIYKLLQQKMTEQGKILPDISLKDLAMAEVGAKLLCCRCGHNWTPRKINPRTCPKCNSPYWNKEKTNEQV